MEPTTRLQCLATGIALSLAVVSATAGEPWYVTGVVEITEPTELGQVIVLPGASLTVRDVPEPGLRLNGHLWVVGDGRWRLQVSARDGAPATILASGAGPVENGPLGTWSDADPRLDHRLQTILTDGLGRTLVGSVVVPGSGPRVR